MSQIKLTDAKIKTLKPKEKTYRILDADRLYIEVRSSGVKVWRFKFVLDGKESSMSLGEYPAVTLSDARAIRDEIRSKLAKGIHPVEERKKKLLDKKDKLSCSFAEIAKEYKIEKLSNKSDSYIARFDGMLKKDIPSSMMKKHINDISSADVLSVMRKTVERIKKQSNFGSGETTAILNRMFIGAIMRYAITTLRADNDPTYAVRGVITSGDVQHARALTREERYNVRTKLENYGGTETVRLAGFMLLYTMLRGIEIRRMEWSWVDFENRLITFPKDSMKKNRTHVMPISDQVLDILRKQYLNSGNKRIAFPSVYKPDGMLSSTTLNKMLDYIGLSTVTSHDFRATASTILNEKGYDEDWIELQLAHSSDNKTRASYNHAKYMDQRRKMMQDWADIVDSWKDIAVEV